MITTTITPVHSLPEIALQESFWYVGSPFTDYIDGHEAAYLLVADICDELEQAGIRHYSPIVFGYQACMRSGIDPADHDFWMEVDGPMMRRAHGLLVVAMDGWRLSKGIGDEVIAFTAAGKPMRLFDPAIVLASG